MMSKKGLAPIGAAVSLALAGAAAATPTEIYFNDFEHGKPGAEWGANKVITKASNFSSFMGRYSQFDAIKLKLPVPDGLPADVPEGKTLQYGVTFDFYCIDSWDGSDPVNGKDYFQVLVDGTQWFSETFANVHQWQSFQGAPDVGRSPLGFNPKWDDSIYRSISVPFSVDDWRDAFSITFRSRNLSSMDDESWGVDNVHVWYEIVPAPGAAALLGIAPMLMRRRR